MNAGTLDLLNKAEKAILAAEKLLDDESLVQFSIGRAYYAMFYVAEALLNEKGIHYSKHGKVQAAYGEHFAKTNILDPRYHRWLLNAFDRRNIGDYGIQIEFSLDEAQELINQAKDFLNAAYNYLNIAQNTP